MENKELMEALEHCSRLLLDEEYEEFVEYINKSKFKTELIAEFADEYEEAIDEINPNLRTHDLKDFRTIVCKLDNELSIFEDIGIRENHKSSIACLAHINEIKRIQTKIEYYSFAVSRELKELCDKHNFKNIDALEKFIKETTKKHVKVKKSKENLESSY